MGRMGAEDPSRAFPTGPPPLIEPLAAAELAAPAETLAEPSQPRQPGRFLSWLWPKLAAVALGLGIWQVVVWSGWKPDYVLPGPLPVFQRLAQDLGQAGLYRYVILPAALPGFVSGLKQGWAFAWRSLMAGEIIGVVSHVPSLGQQLQVARDFADAEQLLALMIVIFVIGVVVDLAFGFADRSIRRRWGLLA